MGRDVHFFSQLQPQIYRKCRITGTFEREPFGKEFVRNEHVVLSTNKSNNNNKKNSPPCFLFWGISTTSVLLPSVVGCLITQQPSPHHMRTTHNQNNIVLSPIDAQPFPLCQSLPFAAGWYCIAPEPWPWEWARPANRWRVRPANEPNTGTRWKIGASVSLHNILPANLDQNGFKSVVLLQKDCKWNGYF